MAAPRQRVCPPPAPVARAWVRKPVPPPAVLAACSSPDPVAVTLPQAPTHDIGCFDALYQSAAVVLRCDGHEEIISIIVPAGRFESRISQADADAQALEYAEANQVCPWWNTEQTFLCESAQDYTVGLVDFDSATIGHGFSFPGGAWGLPSAGSFTVQAGTYPSYASQEAADAIAYQAAADSAECEILQELPLITWSGDYGDGYDGFDPEPVGATSGVGGGWWFVPAVGAFFSSGDYQYGIDSVESYPDGAITSLTDGSGWPLNGALFTSD